MREPFSFWLESDYMPKGIKRVLNGESGPILLSWRSYVRNDKVEKLFLKLAGDIQEDDYIIVSTGSKELARCSARVSKKEPTVKFTCDMGGRLGPSDRVTLSFLSGATSVVTPMVEVPLQGMASGTSVWLAFQPEPLYAFDVKKERPWIVLFSTRKAKQVTARCSIGGKALPGPIIGRTGHGGMGSPSLEYAVPLPIVLPHGDGGGDVQKPDGVNLPGVLKCFLSLDGVTEKIVKIGLSSTGAPTVTTDDSRPVHVWWHMEVLGPNGGGS